MYEKEVLNGAAWLDRMNPGWYKKVELNGLDLMYPSSCSLGQTLGKNVSTHLCDDMAFSVSHGFNLRLLPTIETQTKGYIFKKKVEVQVPVSPERRNKSFSVLTAAWIQEILRRREKDRLMKEAQEALHP
jgi:hypothetical protein